MREEEERGREGEFDWGGGGRKGERVADRSMGGKGSSGEEWREAIGGCIEVRAALKGGGKCSSEEMAPKFK